MVDYSDELRWGLRLEVLRRHARTELEKSQWLPLRSIELLQMRRLRVLLKDAYESVPYYHRVFNEMKIHPDDIRTPEDFSKLPVLKKEEVRNHAEEMVSRKCKIRDLREFRTAGSTSIPLKGYMNAEMRAYADASSLRHRRWMNLDEHTTIAYVGPLGLNWYPNIAEEHLCLYSWQMNEEKFTEFIKNIKKYKPQLLNAFAGGLNLLAQYCEARGITDIAFQAIITSGEKLYRNEKERIERVFGCEVYERYAASEPGTMAFDCSKHSGLHICSESMLIEFLKDGEPARPRELASIVVTSLFSYCMPLIRYDLQDAAYKMDKPCSCGRELPS